MLSVGSMKEGEEELEPILYLSRKSRANMQSYIAAFMLCVYCFAAATGFTLGLRGPLAMVQSRHRVRTAVSAKTFKFSKYHGLGNDFVLVNDLESDNPSLSSEDAKVSYRASRFWEFKNKAHFGASTLVFPHMTSPFLISNIFNADFATSLSTRITRRS